MKYTPPYAPKGYRSNARLGKTPPPLPQQRPRGYEPKEVKKAKAGMKIFLVIFLLIGINTAYQHFANKSSKPSWGSDLKTGLFQANTLDKEDSRNFVQAKPKDMSTEKVINISKELANRIRNHSHLPPSRGVNWAWIQENQETNQRAMDELLEKLSIEIGSSEAVGILRTIKENRDNITSHQMLTESSDPEVANKASKKVAHLRMEIEVLTAKLAEAYDKEGVNLTEEQVKSLTRSPHGEDTSYLINGFQNIKIVCFEMENRLRKFPNEEMAKNYYGTYHVLLLALDRIQKNAIDKIYYLHLRQTRWVLEEAQASKAKALSLLQKETARASLSQNQKKALQFNIQSYDRTITKAMNTERRLRQSLTSLEKSNDKLRYSIDAAENSHTAMLLHTEIGRIGQDHIQEIDQLKDIMLPDMVAADFTDADDPWISPTSINAVTP
jgi:hypothetical protein